MTRSYPDFENNVRCLVSQASPAIDRFTSTYAASNVYAWATGLGGATSHVEDAGDALERRVSVNAPHGGAFTAYTFTHATLTVTGTGTSFATYTWKHLDRIVITGGTGATVGSYIVTAKTSDNTITVATTIAAGGVAGDLAGQLVTGTQFADAFLDYPSLHTGIIEFDMSGIITGTTNIFDADFTYTESGHVMTETGAFTSYTWAAGDSMFVESGTGVIPGWYRISRRVSNDAVELVDSIGAAANTSADVQARLFKAQAVTFKLYHANEDGSSPTNLLVNPTVITFPYVLEATGSVMAWSAKFRLKPIAPSTVTTDFGLWAVFGEFTQSYCSSAAVPYQVGVPQLAAARGGATLLFDRPCRLYLSYAKAATSATFELIPRNYNVIQFAPFLGG